VAVDAKLQAETVADLDHVTVATSPDDGVKLIGYLAHRARRQAGERTFLYDERPFPAIRCASRRDRRPEIAREAQEGPHPSRR
jgi:hypothetical protein